MLTVRRSTIASLSTAIIAGIALITGPKAAHAAKACAPLDWCVSSCPASLDDTCRSARPQCDPSADSDCTYWTTSCWGRYDNLITCSYSDYTP